MPGTAPTRSTSWNTYSGPRTRSGGGSNARPQRMSLSMPTSPSSTEDLPEWKRVMGAELDALIIEAQRIDDAWADIVEAAWRGEGVAGTPPTTSQPTAGLR